MGIATAGIRRLRQHGYLVVCLIFLCGTWLRLSQVRLCRNQLINFGTAHKHLQKFKFLCDTNTNLILGMLHCLVEISDNFLTLFSNTSCLPITLVLFLHTTTVPEATGGGEWHQRQKPCVLLIFLLVCFFRLKLS